LAGNYKCCEGVVLIHVGRFIGTRQGKASNYEVLRWNDGTVERGLLLKPIVNWDGDSFYKFEILGRPDSDYAKDTDTRRSVSKTSTFFNGSSIHMHSHGRQHFHSLLWLWSSPGTDMG
jgi:hypothetical protein